MKLHLGNFHTTIRLTVVSVFVLATLLTAAVALGLQYYFSEKMARRDAAALYTTTAAGVASELNGIARVNNTIIDLLADNPALGDPARQTALLQIFVQVLEKNPLLYGVYVGRADGGLFEIINLDSGEQLHQQMDALPTDRWLMVTVGDREGVRQRHYQFLDQQLQPGADHWEATDFIATTRPWYQSALQSGEVAVSRPYRFAQSGMLGRTVSRRAADSDTVVAMDITLSSMSQYLARQHVATESGIYLFDDEGHVIASNRQQEASNHAATAEADAPSTGFLEKLPSQHLLDIANNPQSREQLISSAINGVPHVLFTSKMGGKNNALYLGIVTPVAAVMAPFREKVLLSTGITAGLLLLLLPLSWLFANPIVNPVRQLAMENEKVRQLHFDEVRRVDSHVQELDDLSESMVSMVASIRAHELAQRDLMDAFIRLIAQAIDDKSPYTGGHCERVPELAMLLAEAASSSKDPAFRDFRFENEDQWREYRIAAWLHDCGKITTPEHIVDKGSKLETIYNRIHEVRMRFEVLWRDAEIEFWEGVHEQPDRRVELQKQLGERQARLQEEFRFVANCNVGGEFLSEEDQQRLGEIGIQTWIRQFDDRLGLSPAEELRLQGTDSTTPALESLLSDRPEHIIERSRPADLDPSLGINMNIPEHQYNEGELYNLSISRGTLTEEDRFKINEHMISTIKMLESLPFPEELKNVPRYASTHHETMKGSGYPRKLNGEELSIPERILAIADVFEALTASDRPYKKAKPVGVAIEIMHKMVADNHLDRDCFRLFLQAGVYRQYAQQFLQAEQMDEVDLGRYLG